MIIEAITLVVCLALVPVLMVMVAHEGWPPWWLMVAGVLTAWAGDALWTLGEHIVTGMVARARARRHTTPGTPRPPDLGPATAPTAIEHRHGHGHGHGHGRWQDGPPAPGSDR